MAFNIADILGTTLVDGIAKIISLFKVDPTLALSKQIELQELQINIASQLQNKLQDAINEQIEVNKAEASSASVFVAGWRPFIGWVCGSGLVVQFIVNPIVTWVATLLKHPVAFPSLDLGTLMTLLFGMLGLGAVHAWENVQTSTANGNGKH
jgi:hypothetical protein